MQNKEAGQDHPLYTLKGMLATFKLKYFKFVNLFTNLEASIINQTVLHSAKNLPVGSTSAHCCQAKATHHPWVLDAEKGF